MDPAFVAAALKDRGDAGILLELGGGSIALRSSPNATINRAAGIEPDRAALGTVR